MPARKLDKEFQNELALDALKEYLSIGVGRAAATLNDILNKHVDLKVPTIDIVTNYNLSNLEIIQNDKEHTSVSMGFEGNLTGSASVFFDKESSKKLVEMLVPGSSADEEDIEPINESTILEVGNIIINSVLGSISNCFNYDIEFKVPEYTESSLKNIFSEHLQNNDSVVLFGETFLIVEKEKIDGKIVLFFMLDDLADLMEYWSES